MNADLGKTEFTKDEIDVLRGQLNDYKSKKNLSWKDLSTVIGVPEGTLSAWVPGSYNKGEYWKTQDVPTRVHRFFLQMAEQAEILQALPVKPAFQMTPSARRILTCFAYAQAGDMVAIATPPGVGKSASILQYRATHSQVFVVKSRPSARGVPTFLIAMLDQLGVKDARGTPQTLAAAVEARLRDTGGLIIVDEAQNLTFQALEEIRSIHDETEIGVALVGDENLLVNLRKYPQLYSRIGIKHTQKSNTAEDCKIIAAAWGVERGPELAELIKIGRLVGGVREITKTMSLAVRSARADGTPVTLDHIRDAAMSRGLGA